MPKLTFKWIKKCLRFLTSFTFNWINFPNLIGSLLATEYINLHDNMFPTPSTLDHWFFCTVKTGTKAAASLTTETQSSLKWVRNLKTLCTVKQAVLFSLEQKKLPHFLGQRLNQVSVQIAVTQQTWHATYQKCEMIQQQLAALFWQFKLMWMHLHP